MHLPHSSVFRSLFLLAWISILVGLFFQAVGVTYSMDVTRDPARRVLIGLAPAGLDANSLSLGLSMLSSIDLASLFAPLFVLCGVHSAPEITPTFSYYLIMAAKIWAVITMIRLLFALVWFTTSIGSTPELIAVPPKLMLVGVWLLAFGEAFVVWAFSIMCCVHVEGCGSCEVTKAAGVCCCRSDSVCTCNKPGCHVCTNKKNVSCHRVTTIQQQPNAATTVVTSSNTRVTDADDNSMMLRNLEDGKRRKKSQKKAKEDESNTL